MQPIAPILLHITPCRYGSTCHDMRSKHLGKYSHNMIAQIWNAVLPVCQYGATCDRGNRRHYEEFSHPIGPCSKGTACASHKNGHLLNFAHTPKQRMVGLSADILSKDTGSINTISFKDMLPHPDLEVLYDCSTALELNPIVNGTGFSKGFLKAAFLHGAFVVSKQLAMVQDATAIVINEEKQEMELQTAGSLCNAGKIEFAFGPSRHALGCVSTRINAQQKIKTIAPLGNPSEGFKWKEMKSAEGMHTFDKNKGVHLLTGCYHSTTTDFASKIFEEVAMVGGGYLGDGMYFTVAPTEGAKADDQDAALKTSSYGFLSGGVIVVALVLGHDGILYVRGSDSTMPHLGNWDLKYLFKGIKASNIGNGGAAELVATNPAQVLPLGVIYIKNAANCAAIEGRKELLKQLNANAQWVKDNL